MTEIILKRLQEIQARYKTRNVEVRVEFASQKRTVETLEGPVSCEADDAILTGIAGEQWPVQRDVFDRKYAPARGQSVGLSGRYVKRTAYVQAALLEQSISLDLSGARGTLHGHAGDWIVWYAPDDAAIVAKDIFPKLYEPA